MPKTFLVVCKPLFEAGGCHTYVLSFFVDDLSLVDHPFLAALVVNGTLFGLSTVAVFFICLWLLFEEIFVMILDWFSDVL